MAFLGFTHIPCFFWGCPKPAVVVNRFGGVLSLISSPRAAGAENSGQFSIFKYFFYFAFLAFALDLLFFSLSHSTRSPSLTWVYSSLRPTAAGVGASRPQGRAAFLWLVSPLFSGLCNPEHLALRVT